MSLEPARLSALGQASVDRTLPNGVAFSTDAGTFQATVHAPGIVRLTLGQSRGAEYGLLSGQAVPPPVRIKHQIGEVHILADDLVLSITTAPLSFALEAGGVPLIRSSTDLTLTGQHRIPPFARTASGWFAALDLPTGDRVYGLGEKWGPLDRRGQLITSRNTDPQGANAEASSKNVPFAWSPSGWGLYVHTAASVTHGVGFAPWSHRSYGLAVDDDHLDVFLFAAGDGAGLLERYTWLTGRPTPVPRWSLGVWLSRTSYRSADEALEIAATMRERRIPCDVIMLDGRAWLQVDTGFDFRWNTDRFPDPAAFAADLKAMGFRLCVEESPAVPVTTPLFADLERRGFLLTDPVTGRPARYAPKVDSRTTGAAQPDCGLVDFSNAAAFEDWQGRQKPLFDAGVDLIQTVGGEDIPETCRAANGDTGQRLRNVYPLLFNACVYSATALHRSGTPMVVARAGWAASQRAPMQRGGDVQSDWEGLAASIRGGLSWSLSGTPWYASDIGGTTATEPDAELFVRWAQQGMFSSHTRFHGNGPREPWVFGAEAEAIVRTWIEFRYRLIPYIEGLLKEAHATGVPPMRAMPLAFPNDPAAWAFDLQYMFGPALLVVPVVAPGGGYRAYLPPGGWYDLWTNERVEGGRYIEGTIRIECLPIFGREGEMLALGPLAQKIADVPADGTVESVWTFGFPDRPPVMGHGDLSLTDSGDGSRTLRGVSPAVRVREFGAVTVEPTETGLRFSR